VSSLSDKSSSLRRQLEREAAKASSQGEGTIHFSHQSPPETRPSEKKRSSSLVHSSAAIVTNEDKTVISKHLPGSDAPPPIPCGPSEGRPTLEGMTLDHFRLETFVGGGGMGAVFRGYDLRLNRPVAIKILSRDQSDQETIKRFQNEAQNTARLDHPHIARVYYIGEDKGWNFIVFEFIEGMNLRDRVESQGQLSFDAALGFTLQIAEALDHAQARDVVHRDIKPSNVLVTLEGTVKLVDMGLARLHQVNAPADDLTASGVTLGTFDYISPEQARDPRAADVRSDIYSLGCTLYFMLAGRPPFPEGTALQKLLWHTGEEPPDIRLFRPDVPEALCVLLSKMMAKRPENRFQSASELVENIVQLAQLADWSGESDSSAMRFSNWHTAPRANTAWQSYLPIAVAVSLMLLVALWPDTNQTPAVHTALSLPQGTVPNLQPNTLISQNTTTPDNSVEGTNPEIAIADSHAQPSEAAPIPKTTPVVEQASPASSIKPTIAEGNKVANASFPPPDASNHADVPVPTVSKIVQVRFANEVDGNNSTEPSKTCYSLGEAVRFAAAHAEIDTIELAFDGLQVVRERLEFPAKSLKIRAAPNKHPVLQIRPEPASNQPCVRLADGGGILAWENVRLDFPLADFPSDTVAIQIPAHASLEFQSCVLTLVAPVSAKSPTNHVCLFDCLTVPNSESTVTIDDAAETPPTRLALKNSIVRGDCTLCRVAEDYPLRLSISDSFIATRYRILETGGMPVKPRWMDRMRVTCQQSTLFCEEGVILAGNHPTYSHRMEIRLQMAANLIVTQRDRPLIEYRGGETGDETRLSFDGDGNFYSRTFTFLRRIVQQDGQESSYDTSLGDMPRWAEDRNSEQGQLANPLTEIRFEELAPTDVVLKSPGESRVGCLLESLPSLDLPKGRTVMGATNMETSPLELPSTLAPPMMDEKSTSRAEATK
jgi:eukaryotic-like serine/threonine-protein kinase